MPYNTVANSTFLDAYGNSLSTAAQYASVAAGSISPLVDLFKYPTSTVTVPSPSSIHTITVGLALDHSVDPTSLLSGNWAQRAAALGAFPNASPLLSPCGGDSSLYNT